MAKNEQHERLQNAALFGISFAVLGYALPMFIYLLIPASWFYQVKQPVPTNKIAYQPCEQIELTIERTSRIMTQAESTLELTLVLDNGERDVAHRKQNINIGTGEKVVITEWQVPCDAPRGDYYITGNLHFEVQNQQKDYQFVSQSFKVEK